MYLSIVSIYPSVSIIYLDKGLWPKYRNLQLLSTVLSLPLHFLCLNYYNRTDAVHPVSISIYLVSISIYLNILLSGLLTSEKDVFHYKGYETLWKFVNLQIWLLLIIFAVLIQHFHVISLVFVWSTLQMNNPRIKSKHYVHYKKKIASGVLMFQLQLVQQLKFDQMKVATVLDLHFGGSTFTSCKETKIQYTNIIFWFIVGGQNKHWHTGMLHPYHLMLV